MEDVLPILLMGFGGLLIGGVISMTKAKKPVAAIVLGLLAALAIAGAVLWWLPS